MTSNCDFSPRKVADLNAHKRMMEEGSDEEVVNYKRWLEEVGVIPAGLMRWGSSGAFHLFCGTKELRAGLIMALRKLNVMEMRAQRAERVAAGLLERLETEADNLRMSLTTLEDRVINMSLELAGVRSAMQSFPGLDENEPEPEAV